MALLEVQNITKRFPGVQALTDVSLTVDSGEIHALVGQNGAGKSTLVKCITGVHPPDQGQISFAGEVMHTYAPKQNYDLGIAVVYQRSQLLPWLSVSENVLLGHLPTLGKIWVDRGEANRIARELLAEFDLDIDPEMRVQRLTAPARQEVVIAKALFRKARLVIFDEPTAALDADRIAKLFRLIRNLKNQGVAILYISHHLEEIFQLSDRITVLRDGYVVATQPASELNQTEVITMMAGRRLEQEMLADRPTHATDSESQKIAVEFDHVSSSLLNEVNFAVGEGEVVGITGVIGAGGHSIARFLFGLDRIKQGEIRIKGKAYKPVGPRQAIDSGIFMVPEDPTAEGLVPVLSVASNVTIVDLPAISRLLLLSYRKERQIARGYVKQLNIATSSVNTLVRNLSGGNQQKVLMAKALEARAQVLVLEEPTQGVDVHAKSEIHNIIRGLAQQGKAILVISTDIRDLLLFVDRIIALRNGRVVGELFAAETEYAEVLELTVGSVLEVA